MARKVHFMTFAGFLIFAFIETLKPLIYPDLSIIGSHIMTVIAVGVLTFFLSRYAFTHYQIALLKIERQATSNDDKNELLSSILIPMREGIIILNSNMEVVLFNRAAARIGEVPFGNTPPANQASLGLRLTDIIRDPAVNKAFQCALDTGIPVDATLEQASREVRMYQVNVTPIERDLVVGVFYDITEREHLERVRREFFANLSHEVRTPLTAILACAETLLDGAMNRPDDRLRFFEKLHRQAIRLNDLISGITDLSAIESGNVQLALQPVRLHDAVRDAISFVEARATSPNIMFTASVPTEIVVQADKVRLGQILDNLLDNAVKFNKAGGGVSITATKKEGNAVIEIADTGIGIATSDLARVFERLYRSDKSRSQKIEGSGLGLAIVKHLVQAHGSEIKVTSEVGKGSLFTFSLPLICL
jgi:two-component system, OmpR family, phosphate regulon sensor histidine kinase PhoR